MTDRAPARAPGCGAERRSGQGCIEGHQLDTRYAGQQIAQADPRAREQAQQDGLTQAGEFLLLNGLVHGGRVGDQSPPGKLRKAGLARRAEIGLNAEAPYHVGEAGIAGMDQAVMLLGFVHPAELLQDAAGMVPQAQRLPAA